MSLFASSDITVISLTVALVGVAVAIVALFVSTRISLDGSARDEGQIDALTIVQEFRNRNKTLEEKLVDLRVKLEILELRIGRIMGKEQQSANFQRGGIVIPPSPKREREILSRRPTSSQTQGTFGVATDPIIREILVAVKDAGGAATSRSIQLRVGRSREHVARTLNTLQKQGLLYRNQETRPFSYAITQQGESEISSTAS